MKLRWWIEFRGKTKIALFALVTGSVIIFCTQLPSEAWHLRGRQLVPTPVMMSLVWAAGWFLVFFVRAEDLHIIAPFDFQTVCRLLGGLLIGLGLLFASFYYAAYR